MKRVILRARESQDRGSSPVGVAGRAERRDIPDVRLRQVAGGPGRGTGVRGAVDLAECLRRLVGRIARDDYFPA